MDWNDLKNKIRREIWPGIIRARSLPPAVLQNAPNNASGKAIVSDSQGRAVWGTPSGGTAGTPAVSVVTETGYGQASAVGTSTNYARQDHTHGTPALGSATPAMDSGTGSAGVSTAPARDDHVHPTDTTRAPLASPAFTGTPSLPTGTTGVTQTAGDNSTKVATTAFVTGAVSTSSTADRARANHTGTQLLATISDAGTSAAKNVPATGNAASTEVVLGSDTRLADSRSPTAHQSSHVPGGSDPLPWGTIHGSGLASARPAAASTNSGYLYLATDTNGGTLYRSTGAAWVQVAKGVNETATAVAHASSHHSGGSDPLALGSIAGSVTSTQHGNLTSAGVTTHHDWTQVGGKPSSFTPSAHASTHAPGGTDPLPWTTAHGSGTAASKPAAASTNAGYLYYETDTGKLVRSDGATWSLVSTSSYSNLTSVPTSFTPSTHASSHHSGGSDPLALGSIAGSVTSSQHGNLTSAGATTHHDWTQVGGKPSSFTPSTHASSHAPGGSDALAWTTAHGSGTAASKPAAASTNAGYLYYETDTGKLMRSDGATWSLVSTSSYSNLTSVPTSFTPSTHASSHHSGGSDPLALGSIAGSVTSAQHGNLTSAGATTHHDWTQIGSKPSTFTPSAHASSHASGGSDALTGNLDANSRVAVSNNGTLVGTRRKLNLIPSGGVTISMTDDAVNEKVDVTINSSGTGSPLDASTTQKGVTKLSVAPVTATDPIAVGTNDTRVTADQAVGTASIRTLGTGALQAAAGNHTHSIPVILTYTTTGSGNTFDKSAYPGASYIRVKAQGGGGGGGDATVDTTMGGGGGSGAYAEKIFSISSLSTTTTVTVGAAGAATAGGGTSGFGTSNALLSATGGGAGSNNGATGGGAGGTATLGDLNIPGGVGGRGGVNNTGTSGNGANSKFGVGGCNGPSGSSGLAASGYGAGGGGGNRSTTTNRVGNSGSQGIVIIEVFY